MGWVAGLIVLAMPLLIAGGVLYGRWSRARAVRRDRAYRAGRCARCGYDVRANAGRCPECGDDLFRQAIGYWTGKV